MVSVSSVQGTLCSAWDPSPFTGVREGLPGRKLGWLCSWPCYFFSLRNHGPVLLPQCLKTLVLHILSGFLVVCGEQLSLVPATLSWPEMAVSFPVSGCICCPVSAANTSSHNIQWNGRRDLEVGVRKNLQLMGVSGKNVPSEEEQQRPIGWVCPNLLHSGPHSGTPISLAKKPSSPYPFSIQTNLSHLLLLRDGSRC